MEKKPLTDNKSMSSNPFWRERKKKKIEGEKKRGKKRTRRRRDMRCKHW